MLAAPALEEVAAGASTVGLVLGSEDVLAEDVGVALAVALVVVVDVVFGLGSSSSPSR